MPIYEDILEDVLSEYGFTLSELDKEIVPDDIADEAVRRADFEYSAIELGVFPGAPTFFGDRYE